MSMILTGYLADRRPRVASPATLDACVKALARHLGELEPGHMTKERARFYRARRRAEGHMVGPAGAKRKKPTSDGTIIRELVTLRAALRWAVDEKWIALAPKIEVPAAPPPRARWLTRDEADRLIAGALAPHVRTFLVVALHTAARAGAILALRWAAVDLDRRLIDLGDGAGNKDRAVVPVNDALLPELLAARERATADFVIEHAGRSVSSVKSGTRAAAIRAGLPGVTPHILRHTAATWMAQAGVPIRDIAMFLGHRDTATTERVYAHHSPEYLRDAAATLTGKR